MIQVLDAGASCHDQQVFNNAVLYLCIKKPDGSFEQMEDVAMGQVFEYEYSGHVRKREETKGAGD